MPGHLSLDGCLWIDTLVGWNQRGNTAQVVFVQYFCWAGSRAGSLVPEWVSLVRHTGWNQRGIQNNSSLYSISAGQAVVLGHISLNGCLWLDTLVGTKEGYSTSRRCTVFSVLIEWLLYVDSLFCIALTHTYTYIISRPSSFHQQTEPYTFDRRVFLVQNTGKGMALRTGTPSLFFSSYYSQCWRAGSGSAWICIILGTRIRICIK